MTGLRRDFAPLYWVKSLSRSLSVRLFLWLFGVIVAAFAAHAWVSTRTTSQQWDRTVLAFAQRYSDLIESSTRHAMLRNRKEDVQQILEAVGGETGVEGLRIYDKRGTIIFSTQAAEIGDAVDLQAEACVICHSGERPLASVEVDGPAVRIYDHRNGGRLLGLINAIENRPECSAAACHAHPADQSVLGVLDVKMSLAQADATLATARRQFIAAAMLTALLVGLASAAFTYRGVHRPVHALIDGARRIAGGDLDPEIRVAGRDEIGQLGDAFNRMSAELRQARAELTAWSDRLETRLVQRTDELNRSQRHVVHMEKMASLGKLAATVAHELNNPLAGILNYAKLVGRSVGEADLPEDERRELLRCLALIHKEAGRCGDIVRNLLLFARQSGGEPALVSLNAVVESALMLMRHHLEMSGAELETRFLAAGREQVVCDSNQIQQALVALMVNAVEAMPSGGRLAVRATDRGESVDIEIEDSGAGIPPEILPHIFEPFFSTKDKAEGVGLGLSVAYGIVQRHGGDIAVDSSVGRGTKFTITLPRRPAGKQTAEPEEHDERRQSQAFGRLDRG